jgi:hypothetical protein
MAHAVSSAKIDVQDPGADSTSGTHLIIVPAD